MEDDNQSADFVANGMLSDSNIPRKKGINPEFILRVVMASLILALVLIILRRISLIDPPAVEQQEQQLQPSDRDVRQDPAAWLILVIYLASLFALAADIIFDIGLPAGAAGLALLYIFMVIIANGVLIIRPITQSSKAVFYIIQASLGLVFGIFVAMLYLL